MIVLSVNGLTKSFLSENILENVTFSISDRDKVGIVGDNGSGKTTLFNLLIKDLSADSGDINFAKNINLSILKQNISYTSDKSVYEECLEVFEKIILLEKEIRELEIEMGNKDLSEEEIRKLFDIYESKRHYFEENNGYSYNSKIRGVLFGLGFLEQDFSKSVNNLSGGQKSRLHLAKILLKPSNLILLDEPTNHLDIESIQFLESYLREYRGSCLIISHDRYFLNAVCNKIFSIENKKLKSFNCGYDEYISRREKDFEVNRHLYEKQQKEISRQKEIIQRFENYGNNRFIKQASSRRKLLDKILFDDINLNVYKGDKIGLVGKNGVGKTTLFKIICNNLEAIKGKCDLGARVSIGYYDQEQKTLSNQNTVMDEFWDAYPKMNNFEVRSHLAKFNFFDEDLFKSVGELSGGERARLELLKLMLSKSNFLLLDEPTNHLDIESKEVLENAIVDYSGTVLIISHDRYFLNKVVNKIWYLEDGKITEFYGNYDYFLEKLNEKNEAEEKIISKTEIEKEKKKKKEKEKEERAKKQKLKEIENKIFEIEEKIEICNKDIQNPEIFNDKDKFLQIGEDLSRLIKEKEKLYLEWENYL